MAPPAEEPPAMILAHCAPRGKPHAVWGFPGQRRSVPHVPPFTNAARGPSVHHDRLLHQRREALDEVVHLLFGGRGLDERVDAFLEAFREGALDEDLPARELVDDLVTAARERVVTGCT